MAEYLLKALAPPEWDLDVSSSGIMATEGIPASANGATSAREDGIDMSPHRSRFVRPEELRNCDLIFTMSASQKKHLELLMPEIADKLYMITEFGNPGKRPKDISDPIGGSLNVYKKSYQNLRAEIERIIPHLGNYLRLT